MARRRYRRYRRSKSKWCSNIQEVDSEVYAAASGINYGSITLVSNPVQLQTAVSQIYTVKNVECSFTFSSAGNTPVYSLEDLAVYIMYVPQGMNITTDYNTQHPEYIMAYKYIGSPTVEYGTSTAFQGSQNYQPVKIKTRLSRKLNTGDQVILFWKLRNQYNDTLNYELGGLIRWWTKAN